MTFLLLGAGIGFVSGVSPGPVLTLVVTETLRGGWLRGAAVAAGPLLADGPIILVAVTVFSQLLYLAVSNALNSRRATLPRGEKLRARGGFLTGLLARALSPHPYLFWFLIGGPTLVEAQRQGWPLVIAFLLGYYLTIVGSNVGLALALHRWMQLLSDRVYRDVLLAASAILAAYGLILIGRRAE